MTNNNRGKSEISLPVDLIWPMKLHPDDAEVEEKEEEGYLERGRVLYETLSPSGRCILRTEESDLLCGEMKLSV